jgi:ankyrin repeat protein
MLIPRLLLEYGADANVASGDGFTAVMVAWKTPEALDLLIENGADVNAQDAVGRTVLMRAAVAHSSYRDAFSALLEHGADPSIRDAIGRTALEYSMRRGRSEATSLLPWTDEAALREAVGACRFCSNRPLASADSLSDILERGADPNAPDFWGWTVLMHAVDAGHVETVEFLLEHGADPNVPVKRAERLYYLYNSVPNIERDDEGTTALMHAAVKESVEIVKILLAHGADPNVRATETDEGFPFTALLMAAGRGNLEIVRTLVEHGAHLEADDGVLVFIVGLFREDAALVDFALEHGVDVNSTIPDIVVGDAGPEGTTLLMVAALVGDLRLLEILLERGADVGAQNVEGKSALFYAVDEGHDEVAEVLRRQLP